VRGVLDILMPQVMLDGSGILPVVSQLETGRMPQHMWMYWHAEFGSLAGTGN